MAAENQAAVIEAHILTKTYPAQTGKRALLGRGGLSRLFGKAPSPSPALAPLSFTVQRGESLGIIGRNGSGKSTLLKLIAGVTAPTSGSLQVHGRVASLLELGAGFHPMLTGRENVYLYAGLLGMRRAQVNAAYDAIVAFAELEAHMDQTVDTYSSGMYVRLAFAIAIHTDPDVFLVDEVLSVGDESFQRKCRARIQELKAAGKTILFVSHDLGIVQTLCDRVLLLDEGAQLSRGNVQETIDYYLRQAGQAGGVHRITSRDTEVLFNHGRLSLYHQGRELTTPTGIKVQFFSLGTYHDSSEALWQLTVAEEGRLDASGSFPRLPVTLYITAELHDGILHLDIRWENTSDLDLAYVAVQAFFRTSYTTWQGGDDTGECPAITAHCEKWQSLCVLPEGAGRFDLIPESDAFPPVVAATDEPSAWRRFHLDNAEYMTQARIVGLTHALPSGENPIVPGSRDFGTLTFDPTKKAETLLEEHRSGQKARRLYTGDLELRFQRGAIVIAHGQRPLSDFHHLHFQLRVDDLWLLSTNFHWNAQMSTDDGLRLQGTSGRIPATFIWTLRPSPTGVTVSLDIDANAPFRLAEYTLTLCLSSGYEHWHIGEETGPFGEASDSADGWTHLNRTYPGDTPIRVEGGDVPAIILTPREATSTIVPSALRTGAVQLIGTPGLSEALNITPGNLNLLRASLDVEPGEGA